MQHRESSFAFLNRSSWLLCERDRRLYDEWFAELPHDAQNKLIGRFKNVIDAHHASAAFELLIHALMIRLGGTVQVEPPIEGSTTTPDFLVEHRGTRFYIEATVSRAWNSGEQRDTLEDTVFDWINEIESPNFLLDVDTDGKLPHLPKRATVVEPLRSLLSSHDPDELHRMITTNNGWAPMPFEVIHHNGWTLTAELIPKKPESRGRASDSTIGVYPAGPYLDTRPAVTRKIVNKARDKRGRTLDAPLIIAVNTSDGFFDIRRDTIRVLLGDVTSSHDIVQHVVDRDKPRVDDAVWVARNGQLKHEYIQGVWMFVGAASGNPSPAGTDSCVYLNPFLDTELPPLLRRVPHAQALDGVLEWHKGENLDRLLGVPKIPYDQLRRPPGG